MTLTELTQECHRVIRAAEADGLVIEDGEVVDLVADNVKAELADIRAALCAGGYARRFPKACSYGVFTNPPEGILGASA